MMPWPRRDFLQRFQIQLDVPQSGLNGSRERRRVLSPYLNSLRYSLGVQPVVFRKATLKELV
jgi:hypothetical protein